MMHRKAWDFLREDPVEKTIVLNRAALEEPLRSPPALWEYTGEIDLFEDKVEDDAIFQALAVMICAPGSRFLVATVQPAGAATILEYLKPHVCEIEGYVDLFRTIPSPPVPPCFKLAKMDRIPNLALGVHVSDQATADDRVGILLTIPAAFHFACHAPASGPIDWTALAPASGLHRSLNYRLDALAGELRFKDGRKFGDAGGALDWIFASGEGRGYRNTVHPDWIRQSARQAGRAGVQFVFGSWGNVWPGDQVQVDQDVRAEFAGRFLNRREGAPADDTAEIRLVAIPAAADDPAIEMIPPIEGEPEPRILDGRPLDGRAPIFLKMPGPGQ